MYTRRSLTFSSGPSAAGLKLKGDLEILSRLLREMMEDLNVSPRRVALYEFRSLTDSFSGSSGRMGISSGDFALCTHKNINITHFSLPLSLFRESEINKLLNYLEHIGQFQKLWNFPKDSPSSSVFGKSSPRNHDQ